MKKRNETPRGARSARPSSPDQERKNSYRTNATDRPSRGDGARFRDSENERGFRPRPKNTEKLFNKPTLKKSHLERLAFDSSEGRNPFRNSRREAGDSDRPARRFERDDRGPRREGREQDGFRGRRAAGDSDRPARRFERDDRGPHREGREQDGFRGRRAVGDSDRPARRFERDDRGPRREGRTHDQPRRNARARGEEPNEAESRRVGRFSAPPRYDFSDYEDRKPHFKKQTDEDELRLNRYIANAGICSRREADELIESGQITVNGNVVTEMGYKVKRSDTIKYGKKVLNPERMVYLLINKPKDYITTTDDPEERKTVMDLVAGACEERIYPVGRLDRNTTGLLLLTNDGELAEKLTHPSSNIHKIYQAELDRPITTEDFEALQAGVELEDGFIKPDEVGIVTPDAMVVGLEIHSGKNRVVRRMFEQLGYEVKKLDRTVFAGLNKKELPRGKWRFLSEKEVIKLKFLI